MTFRTSWRASPRGGRWNRTRWECTASKHSGRGSAPDRTRSPPKSARRFNSKSNRSSTRPFGIEERDGCADAGPPTIGSDVPSLGAGIDVGRGYLIRCLRVGARCRGERFRFRGGGYMWQLFASSPTDVDIRDDALAGRALRERLDLDLTERGSRVPYEVAPSPGGYRPEDVHRARVAVEGDFATSRTTSYADGASHAATGSLARSAHCCTFANRVTSRSMRRTGTHRAQRSRRCSDCSPCARSTSPSNPFDRTFEGVAATTAPTSVLALKISGSSRRQVFEIEGPDIRQVRLGRPSISIPDPTHPVESHEVRKTSSCSASVDKALDLDDGRS